MHKVIDILQKQEKLPAQYRDHLLVNSRNYKNMRECHIEADWLLIYKIYDDAMVLVAVRTGSHSELFNLILYSKRHCTFMVQCLLVCLFNFKRFALFFNHDVDDNFVGFFHAFFSQSATLARVSSTSLPTMPSPGW